MGNNMNSPVLIHLVFIMAGCDRDTSKHPDSEDDANMLQLGEQDQTPSRTSSNGFARQDPVTTNNETEENGQDHSDQPDH